MSKFNKALNCRIVSIIITCVFLLNNTAYCIDLSDRLRVPAGNKGTYARFMQRIRTVLKIGGHSGLEAKLEKKRKLTELYFSQRERIADLIIKLQEYIDKNPDVSYSKIAGFVKKDIKKLNALVQRRFNAGITYYLNDRHRIREIINKARERGIGNRDTFSRKILQDDPMKEQFIREMLKFLPESIQIFFLPDAIHIVLDSDSYGRIVYEEKGSVAGMSGGYDNLSSIEKLFYQSSSAMFFPSYKTGMLGGVNLSGILILVNGTDSASGAVALEHERQHKFFHAYGVSELSDILLSRNTKSVKSLIKQINMLSGNEQKRTIDSLAAKVTKKVLYRYQNEMMAEIKDGDWIKIQDISSWLDYFKTKGYDVMILRLINGVENEQIKKIILKKVFSKTEKLLKEHKPRIDNVITLKARLIETKEAIDHDSALKKANRWVAAFLHTIPVTKFNRLDRLAYRFSLELKAGSKTSIDAVRSLASNL